MAETNKLRRRETGPRSLGEADKPMGSRALSFVAREALSRAPWLPPPHDPRERDLVLASGEWEVRIFSGRKFQYFVTRGFWHLQLWHPDARVSLLSPSRLTHGFYEALTATNWKIQAATYEALLPACRMPPSSHARSSNSLSAFLSRTLFEPPRCRMTAWVRPDDNPIARRRHRRRPLRQHPPIYVGPIFT